MTEKTNMGECPACHEQIIDDGENYWDAHSKTCRWCADDPKEQSRRQAAEQIFLGTMAAMDRILK